MARPKKKAESVPGFWGPRTKRPNFTGWVACTECIEAIEDCIGLKKHDCCSCGYWKRPVDDYSDENGKCLIFGDLPDFRGCCGFFEPLKLHDCINAVVIETKDKHIYCSLIDSFGCEKCYKGLMERNG